MLIAEPTESGPQGYEYLLREHQRCATDMEALKTAIKGASDVLMFPGGFDLGQALQTVGATSANVYVDANFETSASARLKALNRRFETVILSTSSSVFAADYGGDVDKMCADLLDSRGKQVLLKENRGGSRLFNSDGSIIRVPAQPRKVQHSVGVGDCYDSVYAVMRKTVSDRAALAYASCIAAEYACTTYPELFRDAALAWLAVPEDEIVDIAGTSLPWELRHPIKIYVAAPDFDHVDRGPIDAVAESLRYHNFTPRLPVREHGQMGERAGYERRQSLCDADLRLLDECQLMLAVLLYDDPGTLIEIGIAV
jgi:hypothetical protein